MCSSFTYSYTYYTLTFFDLIFGAKLSTVVFSTLTLTAFYWILRENKVKWALIWLLFFLSSTFILERFMNAKNTSLSIYS